MTGGSVPRTTARILSQEGLRMPLRLRPPTSPWTCQVARQRLTPAWPEPRASHDDLEQRALVPACRRQVCPSPGLLHVLTSSALQAGPAAQIFHSERRGGAFTSIHPHSGRCPVLGPQTQPCLPAAPAPSPKPQVRAPQAPPLPAFQRSRWSCMENSSQAEEGCLEKP